MAQSQSGLQFQQPQFYEVELGENTDKDGRVWNSAGCIGITRHCGDPQFPEFQLIEEVLGCLKCIEKEIQHHTDRTDSSHTETDIQDKSDSISEFHTDLPESSSYFPLSKEDLSGSESMPDLSQISQLEETIPAEKEDGSSMPDLLKRWADEYHRRKEEQHQLILKMELLLGKTCEESKKLAEDKVKSQVDNLNYKVTAMEELIQSVNEKLEMSNVHFVRMVKRNNEMIDLLKILLKKVTQLQRWQKECRRRRLHYF
ncbi:uncharacterized protein LOC122798071 isoform X2 [Protopterus annectens]|uniref:uncharacterized protein LOC122798071 isoform X2 n=1 Tax=Protopterus annectens TaxID=7888 RepID=UPI001CFC0735|nr:uncharacterized protein LOC122798071 isoform X2 [Protopterus annectens]